MSARQADAKVSRDSNQGYATWYANHGFSLIPLHWIENGQCSCGNPECPSPGKHPLTEHGLTDSSCDPDQIKPWWKQWPYANIGYAVPADRVILDVDAPEVLQGLGHLGLGIPATGTVKTGNGWQFHYTVPKGVQLKPRVNFVPEAEVGDKGVDLRSAGSYGILPPSMHYTGTAYRWEVEPCDRETGTSKLCEVPQWVIERARTYQHAGARNRLDVASIMDGVAKGERNDSIYKEACRLEGKGLWYSEARAVVLAIAATAKPPVPEAEALTCLDSAWKHRKGREPDGSSLGADACERRNCRVWTLRELWDNPENLELPPAAIPRLAWTGRRGASR